MSDDLVRIALENLVISETEAFTIVESEAVLTLPKLCLKCKRENIFIPKADALRNGIIKFRYQGAGRSIADDGDKIPPLTAT